MIKVNSWLITGLLILTCAGRPVFAQSPQEAAHESQRAQEIFSQLNLTDDQKKQLDANKQQHRSRMQSARMAIKQAKEAMKVEIMKPQLDMARINRLHAQIKSTMDRMEDDKLASILAVRGILTPDQFTKFISLMHKHKDGHE